MNPSANGWIAKYGKLLATSNSEHSDFTGLYTALRQMGFVYGINTKIPPFVHSRLKYSTDEIAKINLLYALYNTYKYITVDGTFSEFVSETMKFYNLFQYSRPSIWERILGKVDKFSRLEDLIDERIRIGDTALTRNVTTSIANALLFVDILTFKSYLEVDLDPKKYAIRLETMIMNLSIEAGHHINRHGDELLANRYSSVFNDSYFHSKSKKKLLQKDYKEDLESEFNQPEKQYFLDLSCAICYSDNIFSEADEKFILKLTNKMHLPESLATEATAQAKAFFADNKMVRRQLKGASPILNFIDNSSQLAEKLIQRNSQRIINEVRESRDLMYLLAQARKRPLTVEEQKKIQLQLLDILKTIPSLTLFLLPGGMLLLPIFAKVLPNMLPSSFDDNKL